MSLHAQCSNLLWQHTHALAQHACIQAATPFQPAAPVLRMHYKNIRALVSACMQAAHCLSLLGLPLHSFALRQALAIIREVTARQQLKQVVAVPFL